MKKIKYFLPLLVLLFSCNAIKVNNLADSVDCTQELIGKIKQIEMSLYLYPIEKNDTITLNINSVFFFDKKNKIVKEIVFYPKFIAETFFNYKNGLLVNTSLEHGDKITKTEYKYDNKKNIIEFNKLENNILYFRKTSIYDKNNNCIEETYFHSNNKNLTSKEKYNYDYKKGIVLIQSYDENNKLGNYYLKYHFNNKGFILMTEFIYTDSNIGKSFFSKIEFDRLGNLTRKTDFDKNGNTKQLTDYKNTYDEKGNIIIREGFLDKKLIEKKTYKITYQ